MYNLFLDDIRDPQDVYSYTGNPIFLNEDWVIVRTYNEFVKYVEENGLPGMVTFDHDLADFHYGVQDHVDQDYYDLCKEKTGYHCALWMINYCLDNELKPPKRVYIHSMNGPGARNINSLFTTYEKVHGK